MEAKRAKSRLLPTVGQPSGAAGLHMLFEAYEVGDKIETREEIE